MTRQKVKTILGVVLAFACAARPGWRKRRRPQQTQHSHQGIRTSLPPQWPKRRVIRSPVVGLCSYCRTTTGRRCPAATIDIGCRAICSSSRC